MESILLAPGTGAANSTEFNVESNREITIALYPEANLGADTAILKRRSPDGSWNTCRDKDGIVTMSGTRPQEVVFGPGAYRLDAAARAAAWGISANSD